jgi:hypothetical protein
MSGNKPSIAWYKSAMTSGILAFGIKNIMLNAIARFPRTYMWVKRHRILMQPFCVGLG